MTTFKATTPAAYWKIIKHLQVQSVTTSRAGDMKEDLGITVISDNPRTRWIMRDDKFNMAFALQESFAYWKGLNPGDVERYNTNMETWLNDDGKLPGSAYGDRMRNTIGHDQIERVIEQLEDNPQTRRAVISIHQPSNEDYFGEDVACSMYLQPFIRDDKLHMIGDIRSQDMYWGYVYDTQNNQYIQEVLAGYFDLEVGNYYHKMNSCHYYTEFESKVKRSLDVATAEVGPDLRLPRYDHGIVMSLLSDGLDSAKNGKCPGDEIHTIASYNQGYADWLTLMTAYEFERYQDKSDIAKYIANDIEHYPWKEWMLKYIKR